MLFMLRQLEKGCKTMELDSRIGLGTYILCLIGEATLAYAVGVIVYILVLGAINRFRRL